MVGEWAVVGRMVRIGMRCIHAVASEVPSRMYGPEVLGMRWKAYWCLEGWQRVCRENEWSMAVDSCVYAF